MAAKFLDITGMNSLWAKIKNTFVKLSDKGVAEGVASLDSDAKLPTSQLPVKNFYASEARTILVCRVPYFTSSYGGVSAFEMTCRWKGGSAKLFVNLHGNSSNGSNTVSILLNGSLNINELKFYRVKVTVDERSYFDIYVSVPAYHRCFIAPSVPSSAYADYSVYNANATMPAIGTNTDADETAGKAILIEAKFIAHGVSSSGNAPVKVDAYGNLSAVTVDSAPNSSNPDNLISSKAVADALAGKANSSDIPQATTTSPKMDGTASAGSETTWARGDHVHPTDTSREAAANKKTTLNSSSDTEFPTSQAVATYVGTAIANKVDKETGKGLSTNDYSDEEKTKLDGIARWKSKIAIGSTSNTDWYKFASIDTSYSENESVLGVWDVYCTRRGDDSGNVNHSIGTLFFDTYKGRNVRRAVFFTSDLSVVKFCYKIIGSEGDITIELYASIPGTKNSSVKFVERASGNSRQAYITWGYTSYGTGNSGEAKPVSGTGVVVEDFAQQTYLYDKDVKSEYIPTGTGSDAPVNGKALADALADGTASAATATALNMGQLGNAGRPVYIGNDGKPKLCDADIAVFIAEYVLNGTSTLFASILSAYNSGRVIILKTSFSYIMLQGVSLSSGGDVTVFIFEGFVGDYIQYFSVNSNNVWSYRSIPLTISSQGAPNGALGSQTNPLSLVYSTSFVGNLDGAAARLGNTSAVGGSTRPVYFTANGVPSATDARFIYAVDASGQSITTQYKICVGSIGNTANTFYFT